MIESDADRLLFFADWGHTATFTFPDPTTGAQVTLAAVPGLYDDPSLTKGLRQNNQFSYSQGQDTTGSKPTFTCRALDVAGVRNGKSQVSVSHDGVTETFTVHNRQDTGDGMTVIRLMSA